MSLLEICRILRLFFNTLTADGKYFLLNKDNLTQQSHRQLSQKQKAFSEIVLAFLKSILKLEYFQKENDTNS